MPQRLRLCSCVLLGVVFATACRSTPEVAEPQTFPTTVPVVEEYGFAFEVIDSAFLGVVDVPGAIEVLAGGFAWAEGPVWVPQAGQLLFSDVPGNVVYRYDPRGRHVRSDGVWGVDTFLYPSGYLANPAIGGEPGANGLLLDREGRLLLAQHGERQIARLRAPLPVAIARGRQTVDSSLFVALARSYRGRRLNSPNDLAQAPDGAIYFTDPTYGVDQTFGDTARELDFSGVYRLRAGDTTLTLLYDSLPRPNGIVLTPDADALIVANSEPKRVVWLRCPLGAPDDSTRLTCTTFADATARISDHNAGSADGMAMLPSGALLATGPGGVLVYDPTGRLLGVIRTGRPTANVTVGGRDGRDIFITADDLLLQARLKK